MLEDLNVRWFLIINKYAGKNGATDRLFVGLAKFMPFLFIFILIYLWFKSVAYKNIVLLTSYAVVLGLVINRIVSTIYFHDRPFAKNLGTPLISHSADASFPSDHTTFLMTIAFSMLFYKKTRVYGYVLALLGLLGGISRVFVGIHFPFDILGSVIVAFMSAGLVFLLRDKLDRVNKNVIKFLGRFKL